MKRITSLFLALVMLCITPLTTIAHAQQLDEYGGIVVYVPLDMELLEKEFREYVKNAAAYYYAQADQGASFNYSKYYYEAADLKAAFDSEWNLFGYKHDGLAYNTQEKISDRDYEQETREITLYMLSQDVQNKADQLMALTSEQKASFYPGVMFDPITGGMMVNEQAVIAQEQYNNDVEKQIDDGVADATMLFTDTFVDTIFGINGASDKAYDINGVVTGLVENIWKYDIQLRHEEEQKKLKNAYREAMIADLAAAQKNVDDQMFDGLYELRDELKKKSAMDTETKILIESLDQLLSAIEESRSIDSVLTKQINGTTIDQEIDRIAQNLVDDAGMTEQELRSENEIVMANIEYAITETILSVSSYVCTNLVKNGAAEGSSEFEKKLFEEIAKLTTSTVQDIMSDVRTYALELSDQSLADLTGDNADELIGKIATTLTQKISSYKWEQLLIADADKKAAQYKELKDALDKMPRTRSERKDPSFTTPYDKTLPSRTNSAQGEKQRAAKLRKEWTDQNKAGYLEALIDDGLQLVKSTLDLANSMASLGDMGDSEVTISYVSSAMYRAKELAEEARKNVLLNYASMANQANIDKADLSELKNFLDSMYVVLNTDLLGESYYATLCAWQEYQHDPEEWDRVMAEKQALLDAKYEAAWDRGFALGSVYTLFTPIYGGVGNISALIMMGDSEYLKKVDKESKLGSWLSSNSAVEKYNSLAEIVSTAYEFPALYEPLFK